VAAKESEERFRSLFDRSLECIYSYDLEGNFLDANQSTLDLLGYDREDIPSMNFASLLPPEQLPQALQQLEEIVGGVLQKETIEFKIRRKDGEYLDFEVRSSLVYHDGTPYAIMGIARDITERKQSVERLRKAVGATVQAMAVVVETRDPYTAGHQRRVADLARSIASEMGLSKNQIDGIRTAASIHDIGKISIPTEILSKPAKLSDTEFSLIKIHPQSGYDILKDIEFPWPVARMVLEHHERMDGSGYPNGLKGEDILLESRIIAVADVVEAIASYRPYRPALGIRSALEEIAKGRGTKFDPEAVDACLRLFNEKGYTFLGE
jgi:PAS domain S-box-containing protein